MSKREDVGDRVKDAGGAVAKAGAKVAAGVALAPVLGPGAAVGVAVLSQGMELALSAYRAQRDQKVLSALEAMLVEVQGMQGWAAEETINLMTPQDWDSVHQLFREILNAIHPAAEPYLVRLVAHHVANGKQYDGAARRLAEELARAEEWELEVLLLEGWMYRMAHRVMTQPGYSQISMSWDDLYAAEVHYSGSTRSTYTASLVVYGPGRTNGATAFSTSIELQSEFPPEDRKLRDFDLRRVIMGQRLHHAEPRWSPSTN